MEQAGNVIRIVGDGWMLQYGSNRAVFRARAEPVFINAPGERAYFSHGSRLRWIDTAKGQVIGRWMFPGEINNLTLSGSGVDVEVAEDWFFPQNEVVHQTLHFDPGKPRIPYWPSPQLFWGSASPVEAQWWLRVGFSITNAADLERLRRDRLPQVLKMLPQVEEMARRDPYSPWMALTAGELRLLEGDPQAGEWFEKAAHTPGADFVDLLGVAATLEQFGQSRPAGEAFEAGFNDFQARGHDPRLVLSINAPETIYYTNWSARQTAAQKRLHLENLYRLAPGAEGALQAWDEYARLAEVRRQPEEAQLWRTRAGQARATSLNVMEPAVSSRLDPALIVALAAVLGALLLALACSAKYYGQRARSTDGFRFFLIEYWSWPERAAFLLLALCAWLALGVAGGYFHGARRLAEMPFGARFGSFAGAQNIAYLQEELTASPEQQILLDLAHHPGSRAIPTPEQMERALGLRVSPALAALWAVGGPVTASSFLSTGYFFYSRWRPLVQAAVILVCLLLPIALFIPLVPRLDAFAGSGRIWEFLIPGASSAWSWLGGVVLFGFCFSLIQAVLVRAVGSTCMVGMACNPFSAYLPMRYGLDKMALYGPVQGPLVYFAVPAAIWAVNLICVYLRSPAVSTLRFESRDLPSQSL